MSWVFVYLSLFHLLLLKSQPSFLLLLLVLVFSFLVCTALFVYQPTDCEMTLFMMVYSMLAVAVHPFTADVILVWGVALFFLIYGTEDYKVANTHKKILGGGGQVSRVNGFGGVSGVSEPTEATDFSSHRLGTFGKP